MKNKITLEEILMLYKDLEDGEVKDIKLLESAISVPFQTFDGKDLYPTVIEKAARLMYGLNKNHAFTDGNKRIAIHTMLVYLMLNNIQLKYTQDDIVDVSIKVADDKWSYEDIVEWIRRKL